MDNLNKYGKMKLGLSVLIGVIVISFYTYFGLTSGSVLMALCMYLLWLGIVGWSLIGIFTWLTNKEKQLAHKENNHE